MKKILISLVALTISVAAMAQTSFPRKHLIEHFTGESCGYCPSGMESIQEFLASTTKDYIWVSHHYGYGTDEYSIAANSTIGKKLGIQGAPNVVFDRTKRRVNGTNAYGFHPGYLTETGAVPTNDADTALANVIIDRSYDSTAHRLTLTVHGQVLSTDTTLLLSVLIKENGTIGAQADYSNTYEGWEEFRHVKTVRTMLTAAMGDKVSVQEGVYTKSFTYDMPDGWVADNCVVVAYITKNATTVQPIINAEQIAVVEGTDGGESLLAEGIKRVAVEETYPEVGAPKADITFTNLNIDTKNLAKGYILVTLQAPKTIVRAGGYSCYPYMQLYIASRKATLDAGIYPIVDINDWDYGQVAGGYRDDATCEIGGSMLYYVFSQSGSLYPMQQWLLTSGQLVIGSDGSYTITATTLNGSNMTGVYSLSTGVENIDADAATTKYIENGQMIIRCGEHEYNAQGIILK